ncbi:UNVERIFIED_ORG: chaperone protein EcpD [Buttiauxella agrestis ATCC 33320]
MSFINYKRVYSLVVFLSAWFVASNCYADIVISGTRIIYQQSAKDVSVKLDNRGQKPLLVQSWLDDGRDSVNPQELKLPFLVTPPVSRIDPNKGQTIRITSLGAELPKDKESLFWFNVLEVPPKAKNTDGENIVQLAFRTRIKMFYRPDGLQSTPEEAATKLQWSLRKDAQGVYAEVKNSSQYYVSFSDATYLNNNKKYSIDTSAIAPGSSASFKIKDLSNTASGGKIKYSAINDYGGSIEREVNI